MKQPKLMNYSRMRDILTPHFAQMRDYSYMSNELGMIYGDPCIFLYVVQQRQMPSAMNGQVRDFQIKVDEPDIATARHIIDSIWHIVHQKDYNRQTVSSLVAALMHHYDGLYRRYSDMVLASQSREQTIFDRFIQLVNQHCAEQHQISYYADRMCLTERYLSTVIRQTSGVTAKEWIDRALIMRIKVELRHTDKSIARIAEDLNFANTSFFCKYFKRETCMTPGKYREK